MGGRCRKGELISTVFLVSISWKLFLKTLSFYVFLCHSFSLSPSVTHFEIVHKYIIWEGRVCVGFNCGDVYACVLFHFFYKSLREKTRATISHIQHQFQYHFHFQFSNSRRQKNLSQHKILNKT